MALPFDGGFSLVRQTLRSCDPYGTPVESWISWVGYSYLGQSWPSLVCLCGCPWLPHFNPFPLVESAGFWGSESLLSYVEVQAAVLRALHALWHPHAPMLWMNNNLGMSLSHDFFFKTKVSTTRIDLWNLGSDWFDEERDRTGWRMLHWFQWVNLRFLELTMVGAPKFVWKYDIPNSTKASSVSLQKGNKKKLGKRVKPHFSDTALRQSVYRNSPCPVTVGKAMLSDYDEAAEVSDYMQLGPTDLDVFMVIKSLVGWWTSK